MNFIGNRNFRAGPQTSLEGFICHQNSDKQQKIKVFGRSGEGGWMSPSAKLLLTTGFCGGFTTFSTFMNEGAGLMKEENYVYMMLYLFGSLALGLIAVLAGHYLAKIIA